MPKLYSREVGGSERILVDPQRFDEGQAHAKIDYWVPSWDCKLIAYGVSSAGAEIGTLRVVDVSRAADLGDSIDHTYYPDVAWLPDNTGFFYRRLAPEAKDDLNRTRVFLHKLGSDLHKENPILGTGIAASVTLPPGRVAWIRRRPKIADSEFAILLASAV